MAEIKNKRISRDVIKKIAKMISDRYKQINDLYQIYETESKLEYSNPANNVIKDVVVNVRPTLQLTVTLKDQDETRDDIEWFCNRLEENPKGINKVSIHFFSTHRSNTSNNDYFKGMEVQEDFSVYFESDNARIEFSYQNESESYRNMRNNIESLINSCPASYDKTISGSGIRKGVPGFSRSLFWGIILSLGLVLFCSYSDTNIYINDFVKGLYFIPLCFFIFSLLGCFLPGKNHENYRRLKMKKKYDYWERYKNIDHYKNDIKRYVENCEVEIGEYYNNEKIRDEIEKTYTNSKYVIFAEIIAFIYIFIINLKI